METITYLLKEFEAFTLETTVAEVKLFFKETSFNHFPLVKNQQLIGLISETDIESVDENEKEIG
jgi:predicted transcriptional regulator